MYSALARGVVRVVGLYDRTSDCHAPFMREQDSFYFTSLCPRPPLFFVPGLSLSLRDLFSSAFILSFLFDLLSLLIYEIMLALFSVMFLSTSSFVPNLGL